MYIRRKRVSVKRRKGPYRKRNFKRRGRVSRPISVGVPNYRYAKLQYCDQIGGSIPASLSIASVYSSSAFDPYFPFGGHQPMFYDNYATLYSKYKVNYATITMIPLSNHIVNTSTESVNEGTSTNSNQFFAANERAARMFILVDEQPADYPSDLDNLIEEGNKRMRWRFAPQNTSPYMQKLTMRAYPHKAMNLNFRDANLGAAFGSAPGRPLYFICGVDSIDGYNADQMKYQFIITYNVTLFDFIGAQAQN